MTKIGRTTAGLFAASLLVFGCSGDDGAAGAPGAAGPAGNNGKDGISGVDGKDGNNGSNGTKGSDGKDGNDGAQGPEGPPAAGMSWLSFADVGFARTNAEKHQVRASSKANLDGKEVSIGYQTILRSGQDPSKADKKCDLVNSPSTCAGAMLTKTGQLMKDDSGAAMISNQNDFSSLLEVGGNKFLVHSFESLPAALYVTKLTQAADTGALTATATKAVDLSGIDGFYRSCAGSITPWGTHISAEEAQLDAHAIEGGTTWQTLKATSRWGELQLMGRYLGLDFSDGNKDGVPDIDVATFHAAYSTYFNGYAVEVSLAADGTPTAKKHYAMGRLGMELAYVMPDQKTVFLTDDVTNGTLLMFVADTAGDLSAGNLFAMRVYQTSPQGGPAFNADIEWVPLGHATDAEIKALLHPAAGARIKFDDMFEWSAIQAGNTCPDGFTPVRGNGDNENLECLKLKPGKELAASRLETRRYAVLKGATAELTKEEGLTYDPDTNRIYIGISDITSSMGSQNGGTNHINVSSNRCGAVFALDVGPWVDGTGAKITDYAALNWYPLVSGVETTYPTGSAYFGNTCAISGLASPDNVTYLPRYKVLMIGEDTGKHQNDAMWAYHVPTGKLTRILTTPYGSEVTSPYWVPKLGSHGYLLTAVQHPYGESDDDRVGDADSTGNPSWIGVVGPFPALN